MVQSYKDLKVWQKAIELTDFVFEITETFPKEQQYVLSSQMQRSALSIPSNIAEGRARHSISEFIYHLNVAKGSLAELETQIIIARKRSYINEQAYNKVNSKIEETMKMLHGLQASLKVQKINLTAKT